MSADVGHYKILGVSLTATQEDITEAYKILVRASHPDRAPADEKVAANAKTALINAAYGILHDPAKRKQYDLKRAGPKQSPQVDPRPGRPAPPAGPQVPESSTAPRPSAQKTQRSVNWPIPPMVSPRRPYGRVYPTRSAFRPSHLPANPRYSNSVATAPGVYYPKHDLEHLYLSLNGISGPVKHSLSTSERDLLRLLMLAHRYNLHVVEFPFQPGTDRDHFNFVWPGRFGRVEVWVDASQAPRT